MAQVETADARIKGEAIHSVSRGVYDHGTRTVDHITSGHLLMSRLKKILQSHGTSDVGHPPVDAEDRADRDVHVDIRGSVQWIDEHHVLAGAVNGVVKGDVVFIFFGGDPAYLAAGAQGTDENFIREDVQFHLVFALHILISCLPEDVHKPGFVDLAVDDLGRYSNGTQKLTEFTGGVGKILLVFYNVLAKGLW